MPDDNKVAVVTDRPDDGVRVLRPTCRLVLAREVDRDRIVSALAMDERKRRHAQRLPVRNRILGSTLWPCSCASSLVLVVEASAS
jgi:hypothetical protein